MVFVDPAVEGLTNLDNYLQEWGIGLGSQVVIEKDTYYAGNPLYIPALYESHDTTKYLSEKKLVTIMPAVRPLDILYQSKIGRSVTAVATSSEKSYGKDPATIKTLLPEAGDVQGPFNLMVASTMTVGDAAEGKEAKLLVVGTTGIYDEGLLNVTTLETEPT